MDICVVEHEMSTLDLRYLPQSAAAVLWSGVYIPIQLGCSKATVNGTLGVQMKCSIATQKGQTIVYETSKILVNGNTQISSRAANPIVERILPSVHTRFL